MNGQNEASYDRILCFLHLPPFVSAVSFNRLIPTKFTNFFTLPKPLSNSTTILSNRRAFKLQTKTLHHRLLLLPSPFIVLHLLLELMWQMWSDDQAAFAYATPPRSRSTASSSVLRRLRSVLRRGFRPWRSPPFALPPPAENKRVVLYFTSLRVVRRTFDDCRAVRSILRDGLRVAVDERDVSMDAGFLAELRRLTGGHRGEVALPLVFVGRRCVGGADEIRRLNESTELRRIVDGAAPAGPLYPECGRCAGVRFVICGACGGSHKMYVEEGGGGGGGGGRFRSCRACNENGLLRCSQCCAPSAVAV